jgi:hypothetical protein
LDFILETVVHSSEGEPETDMIVEEFRLSLEVILELAVLEYLDNNTIKARATLF